VIIFDFEKNIFDDAITTASILLFANDSRKPEVEFINVRSLSELKALQKKLSFYPNSTSDKTVAFEELNPEIKWRSYYQQQNATRFRDLVPFSKYGKVVRGIATGANEYFTFSPSKAKAFKIPEKNLLPCITKSLDVESGFFTQVDFDNLLQRDRFVYLFNASSKNAPAVRSYLAKGEAEGIHKKYLTANRNPWYGLENRLPSPIWVSVFNRHGLRFIRNEAKVSNLTTFHCIYLNELTTSRTDLFFAYLLTDLSREIFNDNRREYGNGLQKFEPNDINKALVVDLDKMSLKDEHKILSLYNKYRTSVLNKQPKKEILYKINESFRSLYSCNLEASE
jgi:adenine-specific DNA-methyltransferase